MREALPLAYSDLVIASLLVLVAGGVSLVLKLGLERKLGLAAVRTVVQLLLVGAVLKFVFDIRHPLALGAIVLVMVATAAWSAVGRSSRYFSGAVLGAFLTLVTTGTLTTVLATAAIIGVDPWYLPQYVIPILGMVLGNGLTGMSLCIDSVLESFDESRDRIESELALGATRWEAARDAVATAVRRGMIPILNSMMVVGIVSLPGMMTGQILQGADPANAVKYQIMIMFMIAASTASSCMLIALYAYRRLFNERHQLRAELVRKR